MFSRVKKQTQILQRRISYANCFIVFAGAVARNFSVVIQVRTEEVIT